MQPLFQDLRFGVRMLLNSKAFTLVAIVSLALGIGANTALFSVMDAILLKSLPVTEPEKLVLFRWAAKDIDISMSGSIWDDQGMQTGNILPYPVFQQLKENSKSLESVCAFAPLNQINANIDGLAEVMQGQIVSGNYYATLGVKPVIGRLLTDSDDRVNAEPAVVISYRYWQRRFASDSSVIGKQISLNKKTFTIIGVTPPEFFGTLNIGYATDLTVPMSSELFPDEMAKELRKPEFWWATLMGRLKPGFTMAQAQDEVRTIADPMIQATQKKQLAEIDKPHLYLDSGRQGVMEARRSYSVPLKILMAVVLATLAIACLNIATLTLARAATRQKEMAIRLATGASRWRLIRQLLTESILVAIIGGVLGALFAIWTKDILLSFSPREGGFQDLVIDARIDWRVLAYTAGIAILTGILFGLIPAWRASRVNLSLNLKENSHQSTYSNTRITKSFLVIQIALSLTLLIGAGLFLRTLRNLENVNIGIAQENLLLFKVQPELSGYKDDNVNALYARISERVEALPGVNSVTHSLLPLIGSGGFFMPLKIGSKEQKKDTGSWLHHVRFNYFEAMQIPVLMGRGLTAQDNLQSQKVAVINQAAAKKFFGDENPLGKYIGLGRKAMGNEIQIVGVVANVKYHDLKKEAPPTTYFSVSQFTEFTSEQATFMVHLDRLTPGFSQSIREAVRQVDPNLPVTGIHTQSEQNAQTFTQEKLFAQLVTFFGLLTVGLVSIGLYGMMTYSVSQRSREMGIRLALGAQKIALLRMILQQGLIIVAFGIIGGGLLSWGLSKFISGFLFGLTATNPLVFIAMSSLLVAIAFVACVIPASRAARTDPIIALRCD